MEGFQTGRPDRKKITTTPELFEPKTISQKNRKNPWSSQKSVLELLELVQRTVRHFLTNAENNTNKRNSNETMYQTFQGKFKSDVLPAKSSRARGIRSAPSSSVYELGEHGHIWGRGDGSTHNTRFRLQFRQLSGNQNTMIVRRRGEFRYYVQKFAEILLAC